MINVCLAFSCVQLYMCQTGAYRHIAAGAYTHMLITQSGQQLHTPAHTFILVRTLCWLHSFL